MRTGPGILVLLAALTCRVGALPHAPENFTARRSGATTADLAWRDASRGERFFVLHRSTNQFEHFTRQLVRARSTNFVDRGLQPDAGYSYRLRVRTRKAWSRYSVTNMIPAWPDPVVSLEATVAGTTRIQLRWTGGGTNTVQLERATNGVPEAIFAFPPDAGAGFADTNVIPGLTYRYRARACIGETCNEFSATASVQTGSFTDWRPLFRGIEFATGATAGGTVVTQVVHVLRIDLRETGVRLVSTPRAPAYVSNVAETLGLTTSRFVRSSGVRAAINGNWFFPCCADVEEAPVDLWGLAVSSNVVVSAQDGPTFSTTMIFGSGNSAQMIGTNWPSADTAGAWTVVSGKNPLLYRGRYAGTNVMVAPRSAIGLSTDKRFLFLLAVDGRQPGYSDGADDFDTAAWFRRCGAHDAMMLDGGGSTTLAVSDSSGGAVVLNRPVHNGIPGAERVVGNHLGVFAEPLPVPLAARAMLARMTSPPAPLVLVKRAGPVVVVSSTAEGNRLSVQAAPDHTFTVQYADESAPAQWHLLTSGRADEAGRFDCLDACVSAGRVYRVVMAGARQ
jgi:hypothetical protein